MSQDTGNDLADEGIEPAQSPANPPTTSINEILEGLHWLPIQDRYEEPHPIYIYPLESGLNDPHITEAKTALYTLIADKVIGADEERLLKSALEGTDYHKKMRYRNQLRSEQREILKELFNA